MAGGYRAPRRPTFPRRREPTTGTPDPNQLELPGIARTVVAPEGGVFDPPPLNPEQIEDPEPETGQIAQLTEVPTKTTNPARPRTIAAGYDNATRTLSVVFRDGTPWNYYDVTPLQAANFRRAQSKGRFIRLYLDGHRHGPPANEGYRFSDTRPTRPQG